MAPKFVLQDHTEGNLIDGNKLNFLLEDNTPINDITLINTIPEGLKEYKCHLCDKAFSQLDSVNRHIYRVHRQQKYKCDLCDKAFHAKSYLTLHKNGVHEGLKNHECHFCSKVFSFHTGTEMAKNSGK